MSPFYLIFAALIGAAFAAQSGINGAAGKILGSPIASAALSVAITFSATLLLMFALRATPDRAEVAALPWWVIFGGLIGMTVVAGSAALVPLIGTAMFIVCMIAGQLVGSVLLDHVGAFGLAVREITPTRVLGIGLALAGVLCVRFG